MFHSRPTQVSNVTQYIKRLKQNVPEKGGSNIKVKFVVRKLESYRTQVIIKKQYCTKA